MEDLAALLEAHICDGRCSRWTHTQTVRLIRADVADVRSEIATLTAVRTILAEHGLQMLEGEPTPRFRDGEAGPVDWSVRYRSATPAPRRGWFRWS
jgi:hypothetical protein